jgi:phosphopantetheinyl transferase (holo-ACP synthase)
LVGNDLVDLKQAAAESNWRRKGYLEKICSPAEQELILNAADPTAMLWLLWTMKEASYKVWNRMSGIRSYSPQQFICTDLVRNGSEATGIVTQHESVFFISSEVSDLLVHSTAAIQKEDLQDVSVCYLDNSPDYAAQFNLASTSYFLQKTISGLPSVIHKTSGRALAASVSHHGRYAAIVYSDSLQSAG